MGSSAYRKAPWHKVPEWQVVGRRVGVVVVCNTKQWANARKYMCKPNAQLWEPANARGSGGSESVWYEKNGKLVGEWGMECVR